MMINTHLIRHGKALCFNLRYILLPQTQTSNCNLITPVCKYSQVTQNGIFGGEKDRFNGIVIDLDKEEFDKHNFGGKLEVSLSKWSAEKRRCIWFKVNIQESHCVPMLAEKGFNFHHARDDFVMMYKWLPTDSEPNLPPSSHTNLGVGAMVFNDKQKLLVVSEQHYDYPHWKLPGGYVEKGEEIIDAAVREVKEETGVNAAFESMVTFRHTHNMMYGNSDIYVLVMLKALSEDIVISQREVLASKWMDVEEYTTHPHVNNFNQFIVMKALEYKQKNLKLDIQKKRVQWAKYVRDINFLVIDEYK